MVEVTLGYNLRCAPPIPFDIDYTRTLGYGAVLFLLTEPKDEQQRHGGLACLQDGHLRVVPFQDLRDPDTGRTRVRKVDVDSEHYAVARQYMIRLERRDLENPQMRSRLAEAANIFPEDFSKTFGPLAGLGFP
jgi:6-phosphofructokinase 1